ncbi:hypothetical protein [Streptomyces sp. NPDC004629]|uniref:hypothetical protein n=1 Tax=Streptomyces sp. NPDC004629 TaxID=3364705 RepID=UPI003687FF33
MTSTAHVNPGRQPDIPETTDSAIALLDDQGTVVGRAQTAERLVGYGASEVAGVGPGVGQPAVDGDVEVGLGQGAGSSGARDRRDVPPHAEATAPGRCAGTTNIVEIDTTA